MLVQHDTDLWSAESALDWPVRGIRIPIRMTVMRLADGRLVLPSPIALAAPLAEQLDALGPVGFIVVPYMHGAHAEAAARRYPAAELLAADPQVRPHIVGKDIKKVVVAGGKLVSIVVG